MILINLLPHREIARKKRKESFQVFLGLAALVGGLLAGGVYLWFQTQIASQQGTNNFLLAENKRLDVKIKDIANLQKEIASLRARQQAVEDLQADRNLPVHLLNEVASQLPEGVYITAMRQNGKQVTLMGVAQSNERVSELLRNLANSSPWLSKPELVEIVATNVTLSPRDIRRVASFNMRVSLLPVTSPDNPVSGAAPAASVAR